MMTKACAPIKGAECRIAPTSRLGWPWTIAVEDKASPTVANFTVQECAHLRLAVLTVELIVAINLPITIIHEPSCPPLSVFPGMLRA